MTTEQEFTEVIAKLREAAAQAHSDVEMRAVTSRIAEITRAYRIQHGIGVPLTPDTQAVEINSGYMLRPHITFLGQRIANAVRDVERGRSRMLAVSMPPRTGKSQLLSVYSPLWILRRHPEWRAVLTSHDPGLTSGWARELRRIIEDNPDLGIALAKDGGAGSQWETIEGGGMFSTSVKGSLTGRGARVLIIDDPVKDFAEAHSLPMRQALWDWWRAVALTRLESPYLVIVVMTRWHEDDFVGRLFSTDFEGDPKSWEKISLPALADADDQIGRREGEPLLSPLQEETAEQAYTRWMEVRRAVGTYTFSAMFQQRPAPAKGAIFDTGWWRFWTINPQNQREDGKVVWLDPGLTSAGRWLDSWDTRFKSTSESGDWVVGQRWARIGVNRYLIAQKRGRWSFTKTIAEMERWERKDDPIASPYGNLVHQYLIEEKANGAAIIDTLKEKIAGIKAINPIVSKEARARAITPECESGNVFLPFPGDPGNEWVHDLLNELRNFPYDVADDQVDALTQALAELRDPGRGLISVPGRISTERQEMQVPRDIARAASTGFRRYG